MGEAGFVQMEEQLEVKAAGAKPSMTELTARLAAPEVTERNTGCSGCAAKGCTADDGDFTEVRGDGFVVMFDNRRGTIHSLEYDGRKVIRDGEGPRLDALRAPTDNDNWAYTRWFEKGLHNLRHTATGLLARGQRQGQHRAADVYGRIAGTERRPHRGRYVGALPHRRTDRPSVRRGGFPLRDQPDLDRLPDGSIELRAEITSNDPSFVLARLGYSLQLPEELQRYDYYGRGPWNNYNDRMTGSFVGRYGSTVREQAVRFPKPQSMGNREQVRWCALTDGEGNGVEFVADGTMSASALPWSAVEMTLAPHPYQLPEPTATHLHLDLAVTGLGGNSCGQGGPLEQDRVKASDHAMGLLIRPVRNGAFTQTAHAALSGEVPLSISRSRDGLVTISTRKAGPEIATRPDRRKTDDPLRGAVRPA